MTAEERAVVDRVVNDLAVVLIGDAEHEHHVPVAELPEGAGEGTWLRVRRVGGGLAIVGLDAEGEQRQRDQPTAAWTASAGTVVAVGSEGDTGAAEMAPPAGAVSASQSRVATATSPRSTPVSRRAPGPVGLLHGYQLRRRANTSLRRATLEQAGALIEAPEATAATG